MVENVKRKADRREQSGNFAYRIVGSELEIADEGRLLR